MGNGKSGKDDAQADQLAGAYMQCPKSVMWIFLVYVVVVHPSQSLVTFAVLVKKRARQY